MLKAICVELVIVIMLLAFWIEGILVVDGVFQRILQVLAH